MLDVFLMFHETQINDTMMLLHAEAEVLSQAKEVHQTLDSVAKGASVALRSMPLDYASWFSSFSFFILSTVSCL